MQLLLPAGKTAHYASKPPRASTGCGQSGRPEADGVPAPFAGRTTCLLHSAGRRHRCGGRRADWGPRAVPQACGGPGLLPSSQRCDNALSQQVNCCANAETPRKLATITVDLTHLKILESCHCDQPLAQVGTNERQADWAELLTLQHRHIVHAAQPVCQYALGRRTPFEAAHPPACVRMWRRV